MFSQPVDFSAVDLKKGFWFDKYEINRKTTIYSVRDRFEETGRFDAFNFDWKEDCGKRSPHYFWDSDIAKWIESVAYILQKNDDEELKKNVEDVITLMELHQDKNGYFNIYHTVVRPDLRFKVRSNHELYCLGHFIEAAVAWKKAVGSDRLVNIVDKYIDLVIKVFCEEHTAAFVTPGHEEIELALIKLYRLKKDRKYLDLCMFFLNERGKKLEQESDYIFSSYDQSHLPVRQQYEAMGHSVRACYLYSAMVDAAVETEDSELLEACKKLFDDIVNKKMYISGGIGSSHEGEAFTLGYDLPNDTAYAETCASIAMMMFADRMKDTCIDSKYADITEREIYNGIISGVSLDGKAFFYENPLEINLSDRQRHTSVKKHSERLPITQRLEVFSCSCCPPNVTRFIASIGEHIYSHNENAVFVHQFIASKASFDGIEVELDTEYPKNGKVSILIKGAEGKSLYVRIPQWCKKADISDDYTVVGGYAKICISQDEQTVSVDFNMTPSFYICNALVRADAGKTALMYGPVLYCAERNDNADLPLHCYRIDTSAEVKKEYDEKAGYDVLVVNAFVREMSDNLYEAVDSLKEVPTTLRMKPYYAFANEKESDMAVWLRM